MTRTMARFWVVIGAGLITTLLAATVIRSLAMGQFWTGMAAPLAAFTVVYALGIGAHRGRSDRPAEAEPWSWARVILIVLALFVAAGAAVTLTWPRG